MASSLRSAVTIRDIAQASGLGVGTVSRALNNAPGVSPSARQRVLEVASQLNYRPNVLAQSLRRTGSSTIAVIMKGPENPFFLSIISELEHEIRRRDYSMTLVHVPHGEDEISYSLRSLQLHKPAGLIFLGGWYAHDESLVEQITVPAVLCTFDSVGLKGEVRFSSVSIDETGAMKLIAEHLISLGHTRFAILGSDVSDNSVSAIRLEAVTRYLESQHLPVPESHIIYGENNLQPYTLHYGYELTRRLIRRNIEFSALITFSDVLAIGAQRALLDSGLRIPHDVSVTGFDGIELARYTAPSLTTIVQPVDELVSATCHLLFDALCSHNAEVVSPRHISVEPKLHIGESTGCVSQNSCVRDTKVSHDGAEEAQFTPNPSAGARGNCV